LAVCLNLSTVINIKILTNSNQQTRSYKFTSHIAAFLSVVLITEMLEICIQTYDQNFQLILKSYLPVVYGTPLSAFLYDRLETGRIMWLGMAGGRRAGDRPHRFPHNNFSSIYRIFTKLATRFPCGRGRTLFILGSLGQRSRSLTINRIVDNRVVSA
jgi:hypothetical protein